MSSVLDRPHGEEPADAPLGATVGVSNHGAAPSFETTAPEIGCRLLRMRRNERRYIDRGAVHDEESLRL